MSIQEFVNGLDRFELQRLIDTAEARLKSLKTIYIRTIAKGRKGDFVYATWAENGRTAQKSLGRYHTRNEVKLMLDKLWPNMVDYKLSDKQCDRLKDAETYYDVVGYYDLSDDEFYDSYGVFPSEDRLGRAKRIHVHMAKYNAASDKYNGMKDVYNSRYSSHGLGTVKGLRWLEKKEAEGHTIVCR